MTPPLTPQIPDWYRAEFKLLALDREAVLRLAPAAASRSALPVGPGQARVFCIDISKSEYCDGKMPRYEALHNKRPRGRDFYDIRTIVTRLGVDLAKLANYIPFGWNSRQPGW